MGSVKDLKIIKEPESDLPGAGIFEFSDRYSVFDWGEMPDKIPHKGESLAIMTAFFFEKLEQEGLITHYRGIVKNGKNYKFDDIETPFSEIQVKLLRVIEPEKDNGQYDYSKYRDINYNYLIPLEFIYRNSIPEGSSFWKRFRTGKIKYNIPAKITPDTTLVEPILDVSTKLEEKDRYISWSEATDIASLKDSDIENIKNKLLLVNDIITREMERIGIFNQDGKIECGIDENKDVILVDALGTPDECRFLYRGFPLSKEILRSYYRSTEWFKEVNEAKKKYYRDWKENVNENPPELPDELREMVSFMYMKIANLLTDRDFFDTPDLEDIIDSLKEYKP